MLSKRELALGAIDASACSLQRRLDARALANWALDYEIGNSDEGRDDLRYLVSMVQERLAVLDAKRKILREVDA